MDDHWSTHLSEALVTDRLALSLVALVGDFSENQQLLALTDLFRADAPDQAFIGHLNRLAIFTWAKWLSLAVAFALAGWAIVSSSGMLRWLGLLLFLPIALSLWALTLAPAGLTYFTLSIFGAFGLLILHAILYKNSFNP